MPTTGTFELSISQSKNYSKSHWAQKYFHSVISLSFPTYGAQGYSYLLMTVQMRVINTCCLGIQTPKWEHDQKFTALSLNILCLAQQLN